MSQRASHSNGSGKSPGDCREQVVVHSLLRLDCLRLAIALLEGCHAFVATIPAPAKRRKYRSGRRPTPLDTERDSAAFQPSQDFDASRSTTRLARPKASGQAPTTRVASC